MPLQLHNGNISIKTRKTCGKKEYRIVVTLFLYLLQEITQLKVKRIATCVRQLDLKINFFRGSQIIELTAPILWDPEPAPILCGAQIINCLLLFSGGRY